MKNLIKSIGGFSLFALALLLGETSASEANKNTLLFISPNEYHYSVHLLAPYYDYWFEQGTLLEPIALNALKVKDAEIGLCHSNETADTIIRIRPSIFYNPQMHTYYSKVVATVFSGGGNVLGTYIGEAQHLGFTSFDTATKYHLNKVYSLAMQDLMTKLQINQPLENSKIESKLPCGLVGGQNDPKISFY